MEIRTGRRAFDECDFLATKIAEAPDLAAFGYDKNKGEMLNERERPGRARKLLIGAHEAEIRIAGAKRDVAAAALSSVMMLTRTSLAFAVTSSANFSANRYSTVPAGPAAMRIGRTECR